MVFFPDKNIAFIHIPKTGGTSVEHATKSWGKPEHGYDTKNKVALQHLTISKMHEQWPLTRNYSSYAIIREPVGKLLSEYVWCEVPGLGQKAGQTLDEFIDSTKKIVENKDYRATLYHDHFIPQKDFLLIDGEIAVDHIYLFEHIDQCIKDICQKLGYTINRIPQAWKSHNKPTATPEQVQKINEIYKEDSELYQYLQKTKDIIFLMTSVVEPLVKQKGIYNRFQRFQQTSDTLTSIRKYCPGAKVCWIEGAKLDQDEAYYASIKADYYFNFSTGYMNNVMLGRNKTIGEFYLLNSGLVEILDKGQWPFFFKISARYNLNEKFNVELFLKPLKEHNKIVAKKYPKGQWDLGLCFTFLYAVPRSLVSAWVQNMLWIMLLTTDQHLLLVESNFMAHRENQYLYLFEDEMGIDARSWASYNEETDTCTSY